MKYGVTEKENEWVDRIMNEKVPGRIKENRTLWNNQMIGYTLRLERLLIDILEWSRKERPCLVYFPHIIRHLGCGTFSEVKIE